jgi:hypothetical protein
MESDKELCLFVGGPKDGGVMLLSKDRPYCMRFLKEDKISLLPPPDFTGQFETVEYVQHRFMANASYYYIYAIQGMKADQVLEILIAQYAKVSYSQLRTLNDS